MANGIDSSVINSVNAGASAGASLGPRQSAELQDSFMTLLVTQLQNQDPLSPMKNEEMTSQLAQINTVSGIEKLNESLGAINDQIGAGQTLQASALIGQGVLVPGERVLLSQGEEGEATTTPFGVELAQPADEVVVTITDQAGQVVNRYEMGAVKAGVESFSWDGQTSDGQTAAEGAYRVRVEARRDGEPVAVEALNYAVVNSVTPPTDGGEVRLDLGAVFGRVGLSDIKQIL
ncbi:flagellar hook assembly protein FlgD [Halomonas beimenensis]|uniref:Basal-body rod modification protein FlgD n=1 Tax=Halomonas beimenensis TaxID=475662 RepID=A0A291PCQ0_9GAMM|nr:flagellar hook assembly protein FlgD [Halomonas beimenensis]ATJ84686.1 flagellar basal-body rod modification protein FlgD [Halomonas beimenensis]